ncbi:hypothetical protein BV25DRAFT_1838578 [Artomyces pyxidatus]|uniref:Uncharacterized protein n=1 Tax=Artomyces pyxidatus TaxID=48021 RepID=A0ACB8T0S1_9AGAM|nr:hypothetical protein BV25DRAFT_1838578 [Artomyces pyxidatus]
MLAVQRHQTVEERPLFGSGPGHRTYAAAELSGCDILARSSSRRLPLPPAWQSAGCSQRDPDRASRSLITAGTGGRVSTAGSCLSHFATWRDFQAQHVTKCHTLSLEDPRASEGFGGSPPPNGGDKKPSTPSGGKGPTEWFETAPIVLGFSNAIYKRYDSAAEAQAVWARANSTSSDSIFSSDAGTPAPESPPAQQFNPLANPSQLTGILFIMPTQTLLSTAMALQDMQSPPTNQPSTPPRQDRAPVTPTRRPEASSRASSRAPSSAPPSGQHGPSASARGPARPSRIGEGESAARQRRLEAIRTALTDNSGSLSDAASRRSGPRSDAGDVFSVGRASPAPSSVPVVPPPSPAGPPTAQTSGTASVRYGRDAYTVRFHMDWQDDRSGRADSTRAPSTIGGHSGVVTPANGRGSPAPVQDSPRNPRGSPLSAHGSPLPARGSPLPARGSPLPARGSPLPARGSPLPLRRTPGTSAQVDHSWDPEDNNLDCTSAQVDHSWDPEDNNLDCSCTPTSNNCPTHYQAAGPQVSTPASSSTVPTELSTPSSMNFSSPSSRDDSDVISVGSSNDSTEPQAGPGEAFFAIIRGWDDGVFPGPYANIRAYVAGYPNAFFEGFDTLEEASEWYIEHFAEDEL